MVRAFVGLLADAAHAAIDLAADALILVACRLDARLPPERRPTYEPLALAGLGALLVVTGAQMIWHATNRFATPPVVQPGAATLALVAVTLAGKAGLSHWMLRKARETGPRCSRRAAGMCGPMRCRRCWRRSR